MPDICGSVGQRIRLLRRSCGWSQEELGERARLHPTYIGGIERGERNHTLRNLHRIAKALQVPFVELFILPANEGDKRRGPRRASPLEHARLLKLALLCYLAARESISLIEAKNNHAGRPGQSANLDEAFKALVLSSPDMMQQLHICLDGCLACVKGTLVPTGDRKDMDSL